MSTIRDEMSDDQKSDIRADAQKRLDEMIVYLKK